MAMVHRKWADTHITRLQVMDQPVLVQHLLQLAGLAIKEWLLCGSINNG